MAEMRVIGGTGSHNTIRRVLSERTPCKALDIPAGEGILSDYLRGLGWDMHCGDIDEGNLVAEGFPFKSVNLNRHLPYEDNEFDTVICANGLHRLYNPGTAIDEFMRILKPGGSLFVNVNNYSSLDKRLRFLLTGSVCSGVLFSRCKQSTDDPEAHVRIAFFMSRLAYLLQESGFEIRKVRASAVGPKDVLLTPLAWLIRGISFLTPRRRKHYFMKWANGSGAFPGGNYYLLEAVKPGAGA